MSNITIDYKLLADHLQSFDGTFKHLQELIQYAAKPVYCGWVTDDAEQVLIDLGYEGEHTEEDLVEIMEAFADQADYGRGISWDELETCVKEHFKLS